MKMAGNTVLITGGASGIGLALTKAFLSHRNSVIACGRNPARLERVKEQYPD
ncbi:MAG TPA: SDR family NAD(P)-dependent oxidoreductase, partial [Anaerolineae bacterium]|nr:SDR family NAD(P)-dependent oxidoreductase [Anaerolineae bacterium]